MRYLKVAAATVNQIPLDWQHNRDNLVSTIKEAQKKEVMLLCCPELAITGYGCEDTFLAVNTFEMAVESLFEIIPHTQNIMVALGLPLLYRDGLYNTVAVVSDGQLLGFVAKQHLAGNGIHYEPRWFKPWPKGLAAEINIADKHYPIGDLIFELNEVRIGFEICEDAWVATRTGIHLASRGVDVILNPSASHFAFGKCAIRKRFVLEGARAFGVGYVYANLLGNEAGRILYDGDTLIADEEGFIAAGSRFSFKDYLITPAVLDIESIRMQRARNANYPKLINDSIDSVQGVGNVGIIQCPPLNQKETEKDSEKKNFNTSDDDNINKILFPVWETCDTYVEENEFARIASLGLFDYLRKSKAKGFVLNLSGGADSGTCATLVYLMVKLGLQELGETEFRRKLQHIDLPEASEKFVETLLYCLYQRTQNSSNTTEEAASKVAFALKASFASFSVDAFVEAYCQLLPPLIHRSLSWKTDDIALQNIQARVRSPSVWLLANLRGALLLCPSNRSEASVGYATMDGDTSGGISPIAGVSKSFIRRWMRWMETQGPKNIGPISALSYITSKQPTAELRPPSEAQTDESDLMPYEWLDIIEKMFVLEKKSPLEILKNLCHHFPNEKPVALGCAVERFVKLWTQNQWKRERFAPTFHLDEESVDPKTWCRFPILSGGYEKEIEKMREYLTFIKN